MSVAAPRSVLSITARAAVLVVASCVLGPSASSAQAATASAALLPGSTVTDDARIAAGDGHVIVMRRRTGSPGSELVELAEGTQPRLIRTVQGSPAPLTLGRDASGQAVAVVSPCAEPEDRIRPKAPRCSLAMVRLDDGSTTTLARSAAAYIGAVDGRTAVVARRSARLGTRAVFLPAGGGKARPLPLAAIAKTAFPYDEVAGSRILTGLDLDGGEVAATVETQATGGYSALLRSRGGRAWQLLARSGYGEGGGGPRVFRAPTVTARGVQAFFDGADLNPGYVARWSASGARAASLPTERRGIPNSVVSAAWDGDRLVFIGTHGVDETDPEVPGFAAFRSSPLKLG